MQKKQRKLKRIIRNKEAKVTQIEVIANSAKDINIKMAQSINDKLHDLTVVKRFSHLRASSTLDLVQDLH